MIGYNAYSPQETTELVGRAGVHKANMRIDKIFMSAVMAGILLSFSCATLLSTSSSPWFLENAPGLMRTIGSLVFPYGLAMIVLTGTDLCTGSFMFTTVAVLQRRISIPKMLRHWALTFFGNLAGSLFTVAIICGYGGTFAGGDFKKEAIAFATSKQVAPMWHQIFIRGIGANCLVCLACFLGFSGREYVSKLVGVWWPAFAFVSLGFDHVVANMFIMPTGIWAGTPGLTPALYIYKGIIPALLGNIIGGSFFIGCFFWYLYLQGQGEVAVDGILYQQIVESHDPLGSIRVPLFGLSNNKHTDIENHPYISKNFKEHIDNVSPASKSSSEQTR